MRSPRPAARIIAFMIEAVAAPDYGNAQNVYPTRFSVGSISSIRRASPASSR